MIADSINGQVMHMPLVKDLKNRLAFITEDIKGFSSSNEARTKLLTNYLLSVMGKLEHTALNSRPPRDYFPNIQGQKVRPKTSATCHAGELSNDRRGKVRIPSIPRNASSMLIDSLMLDSPMPLETSRGELLFTASEDLNYLRIRSQQHNIESNKTSSRSVPNNLYISSNKPRTEFDLRRASRGGETRGLPVRKASGLIRTNSNGSMASGLKRTNSTGSMGGLSTIGSTEKILQDQVQRIKENADRLMLSLSDSSLNLDILQECKRMVRNVDKLESNDEKDEGFLNSDDEMELYAEVDRMCTVREEAEDNSLRWFVVAGQLLNRTALHIGSFEASYEMLYTFLVSSSEGRKQRDVTDPILSMGDVAHGLSLIGARIEKLELDQVLDEVNRGEKNLAWFLAKERLDSEGENVRLKCLISCSPSFRKSVLDMTIDEPLCIFMVLLHQ